MVSEWRHYRVSELIRQDQLFIGDGYRAKNEELSSQGLPFARVANINDGFRFSNADHFPEASLGRVGNKISEPDDVVFTSKGTVGRFAFVQSDIPRFVYSPQLCFWRVLDTQLIYPRYLYYWMYSREFFVQFKGVAGQTDMAEFVSLTDQRRMHIALPNIQMQRAIAHILGTLDDKIELNRRMNATLETMARALFKSWFVDFDPVRAKAEGRDPGLPRELADLFPDAFEESAVGVAPVGWRVGTLADYADLNPESWSKNRAPDEIEYVDLTNTKWGKIEDTQRYLWKEAPSRAQRILRPGDTIVGTVRPGNGSYALIHEEGLTGSTGFAVLRPREVNDHEMVYLAVTAPENIARLSHLADGGAYPAVRPDVVLGTTAILPDRALIDVFANATKPMMARTAANERESRILATLRDALLPKLISGAVRAPDAETVI